MFTKVLSRTVIPPVAADAYIHTINNNKVKHSCNNMYNTFSYGEVVMLTLQSVQQ